MSCSQECLVIIGTSVTFAVLFCAVCAIWCALCAKCCKPIIIWCLEPEPEPEPDTTEITIVSNPTAPVVIMGPIGATASKVWVQDEEVGEDPI